MPRKYDALLSALADGTSDVVEGTINDYLNPPPENPVNYPVDCVNEIGQADGFVAGQADFYAKTAGTFEAPGEPMAGYPDAFAACDGFAEPVGSDFNIPSIGNPRATFLEVLLTPTELNVGEAEALARQAMPGAYESGYETGYVAGGVDAFDATLAEKLTIPFGVSDPVASEPVPMDSPAAAMDFLAPASDPPAYDGGSSGGDSGGGGGGGSDVGSGSSD